MYTDPKLRQRIFALFTAQVRPGINLKMWRLGNDLWRVLVLAILKQGLGCDYDCLQELANRRQTVREMLGHSDGFYAERTSHYQLQMLIDNVSLLRLQLPTNRF